MKVLEKLKYFFRKYSLFRVLCLLLVVGVFLFVLFLVGYQSKSAPVIESIVPPVGAPGDVITIKGKNFGDERDMGYVSFSGAKLTASCYITWADDLIRIVLPANVQDGLVIVSNHDLQSKPALFVNEVDIPVPVSLAKQISKPVITEISSDTVSIGDLLTITGTNFGEVRNNSRVLFTIDYEKKLNVTAESSRNLISESLIEVSELENGYDFWSNTEIRVRVPDGASSGIVVVETDKEKSDPFDITISDSMGVKIYDSKKIYLVNYSADLKDVDTSGESTITFRCPLPCTFASQPILEVTEVSPMPLLQNYQNCMIQQVTKYKNNSDKNVFNQSFVISVYEVRTEVNPEKTVSLSNVNDAFYTKYTTADEITPADDEKLVALYKEIVGKEKNKYKRARLIYEYMCSNYDLLKRPRRSDADPLDLVTKHRGDAYDFAVIYVALLRTAGIPAIVDSGILVDKDMETQSHWWCEFYLNGYGWIPVDVALGSGYEYKDWGDVADCYTYYFGNLDSHHITFSRGLKEMKPFAQENKIVQYKKSFALQTIWEESSDIINKYTSYWSLPKIRGVY